MDIVWKATLYALGGTSAILAVAGFLGRNLIKHLFATELEKTRAALKHESDAQIERLKHEQTVAAAEHSILLSRLQDRRAMVIDELYGKLADAIREIRSFVHVAEFSGEPTKDEKAKRAADAYNDFTHYFDTKKIWLPVACCERVEPLSQKMVAAFVRYDSWRKTPDHASVQVRKEAHEAWIGAFTAMTEDVPSARAALEKEMRLLLEPARSLST